MFYRIFQWNELIDFFSLFEDEKKKNFYAYAKFFYLLFSAVIVNITLKTFYAVHSFFVEFFFIIFKNKIETFIYQSLSLCFLFFTSIYSDWCSIMFIFISHRDTLVEWFINCHLSIRVYFLMLFPVNNNRVICIFFTN